jgi:hypothetical protein
MGEGLIADSQDLSQAFSFLFRNTAKGRPLAERAPFLGKALATGPASKVSIDAIQCEAAVGLAGALGFSDLTQRALNQVYVLTQTFQHAQGAFL